MVLFFLLAQLWGHEPPMHSGQTRAWRPTHHLAGPPSETSREAAGAGPLRAPGRTWGPVRLGLCPAWGGAQQPRHLPPPSAILTRNRIPLERLPSAGPTKRGEPRKGTGLRPGRDR